MFMRKGILVLGVLGLMGLQNGCTTPPGSAVLFPEDKGAKIVKRSSQFDELAANSEKYLAQETKLAGAVVSIDPTDEGYLVLTRWLPYPKQADQMPQVGQTDDSRHFLIRFVGKRKQVFDMTHGNRLLLEGKVAGTKKALVNVFGPKQNLLYVNATCVKIWETGEADDSSSQSDSEYAPTRQRTLCAD
jgi:hypothetical protein